MASFIIEGGHRLKGDITPQGAKNEALQVLCAVLLTDEAVRIKNIPDIVDVGNQIQMLRDMGVEVTRHDAHDYTFCARQLSDQYLCSEAYTVCTIFTEIQSCPASCSARHIVPTTTVLPIPVSMPETK